MNEERWATFWLVVAVVSMIALWLFISSIRPAFAQNHHPPEHQSLHEKFYQNWMMPDNRAISCCHDEDCAPAETKQINGQWYARKEGDEGNFTPIPDKKIERDRDSPDGRSHVCGKRYGFSNNEFSLFCFIFGAGG